MLSSSEFQGAVSGIQHRITEAVAYAQPLNIIGGGTRAQIGRSVAAPSLSCSSLNGILDYQPSELVLRVAAGTPISDIQAALADQNQMLAFEPHNFSEASTIGGVIATGLSGSARPWRGSVKDYVLGLGLINGRGQHLNFGGQVMKNVAGYDVSRMMVGSLGCFGVITDVSLKVLPAPRATRFVEAEISFSETLDLAKEIDRTMHPVTGLACYAGRARLRLEGEPAWLDAFITERAMKIDIDGAGFWSSLQTHQHGFFTREDKPLWRISAPKYTGLQDLFAEEDLLLDWGGAQYWVRCSEEKMRDCLDDLKSRSAVAYSFSVDDVYCWPEMSRYVIDLHKRLKLAYDPKGVFNPGRMSSEF